MAELDTRAKLSDPDRAYRMLIEAHRGLSEEESAALDAALLLILANELGDLDRLGRAIALARETLPPRAGAADAP